MLRYRCEKDRTTKGVTTKMAFLHFYISRPMLTTWTVYMYVIMQALSFLSAVKFSDDRAIRAEACAILSAF